MNVPYIPGLSSPPNLPLGRFLPPVPVGMARSWCKENLEIGAWVLDPFGFNPFIPIEIADAGFPVLVTVNNPIHAFILQVLASAPQRSEMIAALQDLANAAKGSDRMEHYIRSLYQVICQNCGRQSEADSFLWDKGAENPYAALLECSFCGASGEQTLTGETLADLAVLPSEQLHHARALNRIAEPDDPLRSQVENALNTYAARPLIVLQTIINKLEGLEQSTRRRDLLTALILTAADHGNTLWAYPSPRDRPRQIITPPVYQEKNLWKVLENAVEQWQSLIGPIPITTWEEAHPDTNGIMVFQGRFKALQPYPESDQFSAILTAIPRPNQAFWTLSALWTGWIWGHSAVAPIRLALSRQRYDWNWHTNALKSVFESLYKLKNPKMKFWGLIPENEPMLLLASLLAANSSGFQLENFAQSSDDQLSQCSWIKKSEPVHPTNQEHALAKAREKVQKYLQKKGEPASFQQIHTAAISGMAHDNKLAVGVFLQNPNQFASETQKLVELLFTKQGFISRVAGGTASLETGEWMLIDQSGWEVPLIDRVEQLILQQLVEVHSITTSAAKTLVYQTFTGIFTPEHALFYNCLESYADLIDPEEQLWKLREKERPKNRYADITAIKNHLTQIGQRLAYASKGENPVFWYQENNSLPLFSFNLISTAIVSQHIQTEPQNAQIKILVLPGSRANLLAFKKQRDIRLKQLLDQDVIIVKYRLIRDLVANPLLSRELFMEQIHADPPEYRSSQLVLF